jgi:hypothetical protein
MELLNLVKPRESLFSSTVNVPWPPRLTVLRGSAARLVLWSLRELCHVLKMTHRQPWRGLTILLTLPPLAWSHLSPAMADTVHCMTREDPQFSA